MKMAVESRFVIKGLILLSLFFVQASYGGADNNLGSIDEQNFLDDMWDELTHSPSEPWGRRSIQIKKNKIPRKQRGRKKTSQRDQPPIAILQKEKSVASPLEKKKRVQKRPQPAIVIPQKGKPQPSIVIPKKKEVKNSPKDVGVKMRVRGRVQSISILDNEENLTSYCSLEKIEGQRRLSLRLSEKTGKKRRFHIKKLLAGADEIHKLTVFTEKMKKKEIAQLELKNVSMASLKMSSDLYYRASGCILTGKSSSGEFKLNCTEGLNVVDGEKVSDIEIRFQCEIGVE